MCSTYCSFSSAESRSDDRDNEKRKKKKQWESKRWKNDGTCPFLGFLAWTHCYVTSFGLQVHHGFGCVAFLNLSGLCGNCLRNWGTEGFAVGMVLLMFRDILAGEIWSCLVLTSPTVSGERLQFHRWSFLSWVFKLLWGTYFFPLAVVGSRMTSLD